MVDDAPYGLIGNVVVFGNLAHGFALLSTTENIWPLFGGNTIAGFCRAGATLLFLRRRRKRMIPVCCHRIILKNCQRRNRRVSVTLSPTLTLFLEPHGKLYIKLQQVLAQLPLGEPLPPVKKRRPGPTKPKHSISPTEWPTVLRRVVDNQEPLQKVADDYGVSHESVRHVVHKVQRQNRE